MAKVLSYEADILGGATIRTKLVVPVLETDPTTPSEGWAWFNSTDNVLRYFDGTGTVTLAAGSLDSEAVQDIVGAMFSGNTETGITATYDDSDGTIDLVVSITSASVTDFAEAAQDAVGGILTDSATLDFTYNDGAGTITATVLDSPTVAGQTPAALQTAITAAIVDSAPGTLDTLNELAAAIQRDFSHSTWSKRNSMAQALSTGFSATGNNSKFGTGALGASGAYARIGDQGDASGAYMIADGTGSNINAVVRSKGAGNVQLQNASGSVQFRTETGGNSTGETAIYVECNPAGSSVVKRVYVGATDSGGSGYRLLRILN